MERFGIEEQRHQVIELAQTLSRQSMQQWQKAIEGLVALPTAIAVGAAATTLYAVGFVTRGFEVFGEEARRQREDLERGQEREERGLERRGNGGAHGEETRMAENIPRA